MLLTVTPAIAIDDRHISFVFVRASGPGGQNVNKVSNAVELRFDVEASELADDVKARLGRLAGRRMNQDGVVVIDAQRFRSQERNREDALQRLIALIASAAEPPRRRVKTRPTAGSRERRLGAKRAISETKKNRKPVGGDA
jgi:ribosome-associated protein